MNAKGSHKTLAIFLSSTHGNPSGTHEFFGFKALRTRITLAGVKLTSLLPLLGSPVSHVTIIRCEHRCKIFIENVGLSTPVSDKDSWGIVNRRNFFASRNSAIHVSIKFTNIIRLNKCHFSLSLNHHLYADNTQLFLSFRPPDFDTSVTHLQNALQHISSWMTANLLTLIKLFQNGISAHRSPTTTH